MTKPVWDIFCEVIDNWGDVGVCWRLAQQLSQRGIHVRLWINNSQALTWMRTGDDGNTPSPVQIVHWQEPLPARYSTLTPGQAFIEAFGCRAPQAYLQAAVAQTVPPVWVNLEYLSAQAHVDHLHGLPSVQQFGAGKGLTRWFYYPGFSAQTGGLLRELDLPQRQKGFDAAHWLNQKGIPNISNALRVSLFSYANLALPALLGQWQHSTKPIHLLATPGHTTLQVQQIMGVPEQKTLPCIAQYGNLYITYLPYMSQVDFDRLLWSCDLNMVRGEDSWVRALWANKPFIWQPYIQEDGEHLNKLEAFMALAPDAPQAWRLFQRQWSQQVTSDWQALVNALPAIAKRLKMFSGRLYEMADLCSSLIDFVETKHQGNTP